MLRRCSRRLGHQLIVEPLPTVEHDTLARGRMTFAHVMNTVQHEAAVAGVGVVLAAFSLYGGYTTKVPVIRSNGSFK
jgi:hypothetical protein